MRVKWLRKALLNLDNEAAYIALDNPKAAAEFVGHLRATA
ncbi:MAG: type II toxin-antitoxin system RelE/ParE family toxin, partial [Pseudomonadota bacterium]